MKKLLITIMAVALLLAGLPGQASALARRIEYTVTTCTGTDSGAGTDGEVSIRVFGSTGFTDRFALGSDFDAGDEDTFTFTDYEVGELEYIEVELDTVTDNWQCAWIEVNGVRFDCDDYWLSDSKTAQYSPDVPGEFGIYDYFGPGSQSRLTVELKTADEDNAGADGDVFIRLHSATGAVVVRELNSSGNDFETSNLDTYTFTLMDMGRITQIDVWYNERPYGDKWCLSYIKIGDLIFDGDNHWFGDDEGITLYPSEKMVYDIRIDTEDAWWAGTDSDIYVKYSGDNGETDWALLDKSYNNDFERGDSDSYHTIGANIGTVRYIVLRNSGSDEWQIARVHFQGVTYHMHGHALEESEVWIPVDYSGAANVGSAISGGSLIAIIAGGAALVAVAMVLLLIRRKKRVAVK